MSNRDKMYYLVGKLVSYAVGYLLVGGFWATLLAYALTH